MFALLQNKLDITWRTFNASGELEQHLPKRPIPQIQYFQGTVAVRGMSYNTAISPKKAPWRCMMCQAQAFTKGHLLVDGVSFRQEIVKSDSLCSPPKKQPLSFVIQSLQTNLVVKSQWWLSLWAAPSRGFPQSLLVRSGSWAPHKHHLSCRGRLGTCSNLYQTVWKLIKISKISKGF